MRRSSGIPRIASARAKTEARDKLGQLRRAADDGLPVITRDCGSDGSSEVAGEDGRCGGSGWGDVFRSEESVGSALGDQVCSADVE